MKAKRTNLERRAYEPWGRIGSEEMWLATKEFISTVEVRDAQERNCLGTLRHVPALLL